MKSSTTEKWVSLFLKIVAVSMAVYHFYVALTGLPEPLVVRPIHVSFVLFLGLLKIRASKRADQAPPWYDWALAVLGASSAVYVLLNYERIALRLIFFDPVTLGDWFFGVVTIALILELTRRTIGNSLVLLVALCILYTLFGSYAPGPFRQPNVAAQQLLEQLFLTSSGTYGPLASLTLAEIFMFIFFGALLQSFGGSVLFTRIAETVTRRARGGPAKAAVVGSALFGMISGSGPANVYATGSVTIPMMKKAGFKSEFAAAVEAMASTLGQLIPPVMGATAFLIAEYSRVSYLEVAKAAIIPSVLYVFAIYLSVHYETVKVGIGRYKSDEDNPGMLVTFKDYGHLLIPVCVLVYLLAERRTAYYAATIATLSILGVIWLRPATRTNLRTFLDAIETGIWRVIALATTVISAGIAVAALQTTGTPFKITAIILGLAGGNMFIVILLVAMVVIVLGMGLPPTGAFLIASVFGGSALIEFGVTPFVAYMFIFMYGIVALVTPPVCVSSYAAASIAESSYVKTGWTAFKLGLPAYIIPVMIVYNPTLMFPFKEHLWFGVETIVTAVIGVTALVSALSNHLLARLNIVQRSALVCVAFLTLWPGVVSDFIGLAALAVILVWQYVDQRRAPR